MAGEISPAMTLRKGDLRVLQALCGNLLRSLET